MATGQSALFILRGHTYDVVDAHYSPDSCMIVTASWDKTVRLWEIRSDGKSVVQRHNFTDHWTTVFSACFSPDGKVIASASATGEVFLRVPGSGERVKVIKASGFHIYNVMFSPDGRYLLTSSADRTARIWDAATGEEKRRFTHPSPVEHAVYSPDGMLVATACRDGSIWLWDIVTGEDVGMLGGHEGRTETVAFCVDGMHLVSSGDDRRARLWVFDPRSGDGREVRAFVGHTSYVTGATPHPHNRNILATSSLDRSARLWNLRTGDEILRISGHTDGVHSAQFRPDGRALLTTSNDHTARVWDVSAWVEEA